MNKEELEYVLEALRYGMNDCISDDAEYHYNTFANAFNIVNRELEKKSKKKKR